MIKNGFAKLWAGQFRGPAAAFLIALALFSINLDRGPHPDELHHVLAAQHLLESGRPSIGAGEYHRGLLHTWLVAISYSVFGEGLPSARLPSVLLVALIVPILFVWVRREAGSLAAWLTSLIFLSSPFTVEIAQFSRFYALQLAFFTLGAIAVYYAVWSPHRGWRPVWLFMFSAMSLYMSVWMQPTSLVGLVGVGVWCVGLAVLKTVGPATSRWSYRYGAVPAILAAGGIAAVALMSSDLLGWSWHQYRHGSLFYGEKLTQFWFYHVRYLGFYTTLWSLVGVLGVMAAVWSPRLSWFAIAIFGTGFLLMSFAGPKATRYLAFAWPFLAIIWGVGLAAIATWLKPHLATGWQQLLASLSVPESFRPPVATCVVIAGLLVTLLMNAFWLRTATVIADIAMPMEVPTTNWTAARSALSPWVSSAEIVVTTEELGAIYFLGRADVTFNPSKLGEVDRDQRQEFSVDPRTGLPTIATAASLQMLISCFSSGLVVGPVETWGDEVRFDRDATRVVELYAEPIAVPKDSYLFAWGWKKSPGGPTPDNCQQLRDRLFPREHP